MQHTLMYRNLTRALATVGVAAVTWFAASPAAAQEQPAGATQTGSRYRVLVPKLEIRPGANEKFGNQLADALRKDIDKLATHQSVDKKELGESLKKFKLKEDELDCIKARQLAVQIGAELVMCGIVEPGKVSAQFIGAKTGETFEVPSFPATDPLAAERQIFTSFEKYINQLSLTAFCTDYLASSQWQNAIDNCSKALEVNQQSSTGLYGRARGYMGLAEAADAAKDSARAAESYVKALADLKQALVVNEVHQESLRAAGIVAARLGQPEDSRKYFRQYLELNPGAASVRLTLAGEAAKSGDPEGALRMAEEGIVADSTSLDVLQFAGHWAMQAAQKAEATARVGAAPGTDVSAAGRPLYDKAIGYYQKAIELKPKDVDPGVYTNLIIALNQAGRPADAVTAGQQATQAFGDKSAIWTQYAEALKSSGRIPDALAALDSALAKDAEAPRIFVRRGGWLLESGNLEGARAAFQQAVQRNELPADDIAKTIFGVAYNEKFKTGKQDEALEYFSLVRDVASSPETKGMANFWTGLVWYQRATNAAKPNTLAASKSAVPLFQRALEYFGQADVYAASESGVRNQLSQMEGYSRQFIEHVRKQEADAKKKKP
jgi:tetratricopeptide (TPR) repeat protein